MSLRNSLSVATVLASLALLAACGSNNGGTIITPPPSGSFTNADLNGTYVFSTNGVDSSLAPLSILGVISADGSGNITGGSVDVVASAVGLPDNNEPINGGSTYSITADGRGTIALVTNSALGEIDLDFVLTQTGHGSIVYFDSLGIGSGNGSGTIDIQSSGSTQPVGSYAFALAGLDGNFDTLATAGIFTFGSGSAVTGVQDFNDSGILFLNQNLTGSVVVGAGTTPGTATLTSAFGPLNFDFYVVDANHIKFIETDLNSEINLQMLAGDAFTSQSSLPTGTLAFTMAGSDSVFNPTALGGTMSSDGTTITVGAEDLNESSTISSVPTPFSGSFGTISGGRATMTLTGFAPGSGFAVYPSSGGLLMLETDTSATLLGAGYVQSSTTLAASQGYGLNLQAFNFNAETEEDDIAEFTASSTAFTGVADFFDAGLQPDGNESISGSYTLSGGRGTSALEIPNGGLTAFNIVFYPIDGSRFIFINDGTDLLTGTGSFGLQSAPSAQAALLHMAAVHGRSLPNVHRSLGNMRPRPARRQPHAQLQRKH